MTKNDILASKKARLAILESNNKNIKSQGVVKKLRRQIRNLEKQIYLRSSTGLELQTLNLGGVGSNPTPSALIKIEIKKNFCYNINVNKRNKEK